MIHHGFKKGKRVFVILNDGRELVSKFVDSNSQFIILEDYKIPWKDIRATTINKNRSSDIYNSNIENNYDKNN